MKNNLKEQRFIHTPESISKMQKPFKNNRVQYTRYAMVKGVLMNYYEDDKKLNSDEEYKEHLDRRIRHMNSNLALHKIELKRNLSDSLPLKISRVSGQKEKQRKDIILIDEETQRLMPMQFQHNTNLIGLQKDVKINSKSKGSTESMIETTSIIAYEGQAISLLCLFQFNIEKGIWEYKQTISAIAGGIKELLELLKFHQNKYQSKFSVGLLLTGLFFFLSGVYTVRYLLERQIINMQYHIQALDKTKPLKQGGSKVEINEKSLCIICMENAKNVIMVPCNHLCSCNRCFFKQFKDIQDNGRVTQLKCPVCRTPVEIQKTILIELKPKN
ncbi:e3 ubiquitin-protein ligase mgrn1 [Stylonychia lemnae]|uniref:E3 ubiquitin-protein ligase mgrn1 n=1 Tax=Stylonychia lemnae TaxID=5949 RepID=A0A078A3P1_STYLE|nr:e3 ubiquitin-protein ligase mgrn1 [Stylonychia lemnae]|eukprot:CDW76868.1 e3 ubiquitin-protein ligase mgrn1 [Stylonychia lemnae]